MFYVIAILLVLILAVLLLMNSKINQTRREMTGLPISATFPIQQKLKHEMNHMLVVSTECAVCQRIFNSLKNKGQLNTLYPVFKDEPKAVQVFVAEHPHLKKAHIISNMNPQQLYIQTTPLAYTINQSGTILKKQAVVSLKELNL
ncbi:hypothetical protein [Staphylococcus intermedius]|uniref:Uncharacterized protein n=1 Tax=Staphylococcus intermedius NCTC 11048 TaxID=1141106 RepID=A0A380G482_STAIN|nr:hypothetical protein [Staphylococcus intermedius]PCF64125.1 hypothetical protein B5C04_09135 [Staphylococcus intermedius]PCF78840.1 hypothetical protein B4W74_09485 [Staphylococcus intermedius]PCF79813.1 hypothetical protein B4W70_09125 [Staphylococcus intermedius]PCF85006.1 hypothetical protein B4W76_10955 [Staphylococcus intermedius]PCF89528.1 hypothetical protein B4W75_01420 [Staphylococcus intermedius]